MGAIRTRLGIFGLVSLATASAHAQDMRFHPAQEVNPCETDNPPYFPQVGTAIWG